MSSRKLIADAELEKLQHESFSYFLHETNPDNGLVIDKTAADWQWAQNHGATVTHGWKPESGFLKYRWEGYDEAMLLYILGLGSPAHPLPESCYAAWTSTYRWEHCYGYEYLYAGPLFTHQLSHIWIDFRGIQDAFMRDKGIDYFENSRRATYVQQQYAMDNPLKFAGYGRHCWGITASDGPGPDTIKVSGIERQFFDYLGRGVPYGPDDGTIAPCRLCRNSRESGQHKRSLTNKY